MNKSTLAYFPGIALALTAVCASAEPERIVLVPTSENADTEFVALVLSDSGDLQAGHFAEALHRVTVHTVVTPVHQQASAEATPQVEQIAGALSLIVSRTGSAGLSTHARAVANAVLQRTSGGTVLVVGHSDTVPAIIRALGGPELPALCEHEEDSLLVLRPGKGSVPASLIRKRFGARHGAAAACEQALR